jgi:hypothetical protein
LSVKSYSTKRDGCGVHVRPPRGASRPAVVDSRLLPPVPSAASHMMAVGLRGLCEFLVIAGGLVLLAYRLNLGRSVVGASWLDAPPSRIGRVGGGQEL